MKIYKLNKVVLSIANNPSPFLNGLASSTLDKPKNAFLDVHGKIIATFDQLQINEDEFLVLIERPFVEAVYKHLERFAKLSKVVIQEKDLKVYFDLDRIHPEISRQNSRAGGPEAGSLPPAAASSPNTYCVWLRRARRSQTRKQFGEDVGHEDGRVPQGQDPQQIHSGNFRTSSSVYPIGADEFLIPQKCGQLVVSPKDLQSTISEEEFTLFRLQNNIPIHGIDYQNEMLLNVDEHEYISFTKGCFLGQELVAKVHNRSQPTWKLMVKYEDDHSQEQRQDMTSRMMDPRTNRIFGFAFVKNINSPQPPLY